MRKRKNMAGDEKTDKYHETCKTHDTLLSLPPSLPPSRPTFLHDRPILNGSQHPIRQHLHRLHHVLRHAPGQLPTLPARQIRDVRKQVPGDHLTLLPLHPHEFGLERGRFLLKRFHIVLRLDLHASTILETNGEREGGREGKWAR